MISSAPIAICLLNGNYPSNYWNLAGVTDIKAPSELWWSSNERRPLEDGRLTSEYLELDMGRVRSFNFLNFSILQKPIDIFVDYDVWGFDSGIKNWQPVTRLTGERFDDRVDYLSTQANPWKDCQFYFSNVKGDMLSTRYLRLRFERRDQVWPNATISGTFPWSVDVRHLRTARYAVSLNDTRGLLTNQGKVVSRIVDPVRSVDDAIVTMKFIQTFELDAATAQVVGVPSDPGDIYTPRPTRGVDGEIYLAYWASADTTGIIADADGYNGLDSLVINGNTQQSNSGGSLIGYGYDTDTASHTASQLPSFRVGYAFFLGFPTPAYAWIFAIGSAGMAGGHDAFLRDRASFMDVSGFATLDFGIMAPPIGDLLTLFFAIGEDATITNDTALVADGFTLQDQSVTDPTTHYTGYLYTKTATGLEGSHYTPPAVTLSASVHWGAASAYIGTPATYDGYLMDSGVMFTDPSPRGLEHGPKFAASIHG